MTTIPGMILQDILDRLRNTVESTMQQLENDLGVALQEEILRAGNELNRLIDSFAAHYHAVLQETIDKLDAEVIHLLNEIQNRVQQFQTVSGAALEALRRSTQVLLNQIPFANTTPQVIDMHPHMLIPGTETILKLRVNYVDAAKYVDLVTLESGDLRGEAMTTTTTDMFFRLPPLSADSKNPKNLRYVTWTLKMPFKESILQIYPTVAKFRVTVGVVPPTSGMAHLTYSTTTLAAEPHFKICKPPGTPGYTSPWANEGYAQFNGNAYYPQKFPTVIQELYPDTGFEFDLSDALRPVLDVIHEHGDHHQEMIVARDRIILKIGTYALNGKYVGIVSIRVRCYQTRMVNHITHREEVIQLPWSENRLIAPAPGEVIERLEFKAYNDRIDQFASPASIPGCILRINLEPNHAWRIWAELPHELSTALHQLPESLVDDLTTLNRLAHLIPLLDHLQLDRPQIANLKLLTKRFAPTKH